MSSKPVTYFTVTLERNTVLRETFTDAPILRALDIYHLFAYLEHMDREHHMIALLDTHKRLIGLHTAAIGTLDMAVCAPREIMTVLITGKAHSWVMAHNHPSGDPTPSHADHNATQRLAAAGELLGIPLLDHIVIGECGAYVAYSQHHAEYLNPVVTLGRSTRRKRSTPKRLH